GMIRTAGQRLADALVNVATRGAARPNGTFPAPLVHLVIGHHVVTQLLAMLASDGSSSDEPFDLDPDDVDRRCELIDGTPIHPRVALAAAALGSFRRQVIRGASETLDLGRKVRAFPPALKAALLVAARGRCQVRGCDAPTSRLQADHIKAWNRHGPTALHNGQILCDTHNRTKRDGPAP
ncbi:MAG: HNH endonuclease, partial [Acidimicrobiia bacterium]|nr:HNH endonuclease [Acidimicrobiia bacterium]